MDAATLMKPTTSKVLALLNGSIWFNAVGKTTDNTFNVVESWFHALASCSSHEWKSVLNEGFNILGAKVQSRAMPRYQEWNDAIYGVRPHVLELAQRKTEALTREHKLPDEFRGSVYGSVLGIAMESEYSDVTEPGFFTNVILPCYLNGHFPCGWEGDFPAGRLIVY